MTTRSYVPLILAIIGGVIGIIGGACNSFLGDLASTVSDNVGYTIGGYLSLVGAVIGLIGGCLTRTKKAGLYLLIVGVVAGVVSLILMGEIVWMTLVATILFLIGAIVTFFY